ncbi:MAG TPA: oxygenase MpaB family protein [Galbitalea sp.]|jgi:uncharacterized protein (DUF2236 family)
MASAAVERFAADGVLIVGGARAILLQVADPVVAAGVARHSDFANRPLERLHNTLTYAYAVVLGDNDDAAAVSAHVNRRHVPVRGADDPALQLWVAATLYDTAALVHTVVYGEPDDELADALYRAYEPLGAALRMPASSWPANRTAFDEYFTGRVGSLEVAADARAIAHDLFHPTSAPLWLRAALPLAQLLTIDLLPASVARAYGFHFGPLQRWQAAQAWRVIRLVAFVLPARVKAWPARHYLRELRRRAAPPVE